MQVHKCVQYEVYLTMWGYTPLKKITKMAAI